MLKLQSYCRKKIKISKKNIIKPFWGMRKSLDFVIKKNNSSRFIMKK